GSSLARSIAAWRATVPSSCADSDPSAPLKLPTGVRAAATMTMSSILGISFLERCPGIDMGTPTGKRYPPRGTGERPSQGAQPFPQRLPQHALGGAAGRHADMAGGGFV